MSMQNCLICNSPMKLSKKFDSRAGKQGVYRVRRFNCTVCDYSELVTADGGGERAREQQALNDQKNILSNNQKINYESSRI